MPEKLKIHSPKNNEFLFQIYENFLVREFYLILFDNFSTFFNILFQNLKNNTSTETTISSKKVILRLYRKNCPFREI